MLQNVFFSVLAIFGIRNVIHLNLVNHLSNSDLGGEKLEFLGDTRQLFAVRFIISVSLGQRRDRLPAKGHLSSFYCHHNKSEWPQKRLCRKVTHWRHRGAVQHHIWVLRRMLVPDRLVPNSVEGENNPFPKPIQRVMRSRCLFKCLLQYRRFDVSRRASVHFIGGIDRHRACLGCTLFMAVLGFLPVAS